MSIILLAFYQDDSDLRLEGVKKLRRELSGPQVVIINHQQRHHQRDFFKATV